MLVRAGQGQGQGQGQAEPGHCSRSWGTGMLQPAALCTWQPCSSLYRASRELSTAPAQGCPSLNTLRAAISLLPLKAAINTARGGVVSSLPASPGDRRAPKHRSLGGTARLAQQNHLREPEIPGARQHRPQLPLSWCPGSSRGPGGCASVCSGPGRSGAGRHARRFI